MHRKNIKRKAYGSSREDEEKQLAEIIDVAQKNLERTEKYNKELTEELEDLRNSYTTRDKEIQVLWNNAKSHYQQNRQELMRCLKAREKPYFGRIDFKDPKVEYEESYYIGRVGIIKDGVEPLVIDWRAPLASVYYENTLGPCSYEVKNEGIYKIDLNRKRTYEIKNDKLIDFFDSDVVANDELLTKYLAKSKKAVLGEIIGTIQKEQNTIIRTSPKTNMIVQGVAGSGKTTVAMHRISYILYNYETFCPQDFYVIGSNKILLNYITSVLPDLDVYGVSQMTMEQLFIRLLYEEWEPKIHKVKILDKKDEHAYVKGKFQWFHDLEDFCWEYEFKTIPTESVVIEKTGVVLLSEEKIINYLKERPMYSLQLKINELNQILLSKLEDEIKFKSITYSPEEKKQLNHDCKYHFGKDKWKVSIFEIYENFLENQRKKGYHVAVTDAMYDIYDLAALAYLYKRIKEIDGIREASHIIIDEAQDFGMMAYGVLNYCLRGCTYTIMGDVSQNIHFGYGLNDWEDLKKLMLTGAHDSFDLLKKSYRNTVEISNFATEILRHGNFSIYPVEPIIRHGNEVLISNCSDEKEIINEVVKLIQQWQKNGHETIAVICRDEIESEKVRNLLSKYITIMNRDLESAVFEQGVMVLPVEYSKGLEFDAVIIYNPTTKSYPAKDQYVKLLYVAATRALHELAVMHIGDLTELIAKPISDEKRMSFLQEDSVKEKVDYRKVEFEISEEKKQEELERYYQRTLKNYSKPKQEQQSKEAFVTKEVEKKMTSQKRFVGTNTTEGETNSSPYRFNSIVDNNRLKPKGHSRIDCAIRWVKKEKTHMDFISRYGVLRLTPVMDNVIRVQFQKGMTAEFMKCNWEYEAEKLPSWTARKSPTQFEVATSLIAIRMDKNTGSLYFYDKKGGLLLKENSKLPRQIEDGAAYSETWNYFEWSKNQKLYAKGILEDDLERMNGKARYISFGGKRLRMPLMISDMGYGLGIAAEDAVICCDIPMYGQYLYTEKKTQIDYYFIFGGGVKETIEIYKELIKA